MSYEKDYDELIQEIEQRRQEAIDALTALEKACEEISASRHFSNDYRQACNDSVVLVVKARLSIRLVGKP